MKNTLAAAAALLALSACGDGNPFFAPEPEPVPTAPVIIPPTTAAIPETVQGSVTNITFDDVNNTLTVTGLLRDGDTVTQEYRRRAGLDQGVYQAYTFQDDPLDEHTTVYVRRHGDVEAAVAATGGQFTFYSGGVTYQRAGGFDPIIPSTPDDRGLASYAGEYVGLSNLNGPNTDLDTTGIPPGLDPTVTPAQAGVVNGNVLINVEFATNEVAGEVYNRTINSDAFGVVAIPDLILVPTKLQEDGTFAGTVELPGTRNEVGEFGGTLGGVQAETVAGGIFAAEHFDTAIPVTGEEEYGIFVLGRCSGPLEDDPAVCGPADPE